MNVVFKTLNEPIERGHNMVVDVVDKQYKYWTLFAPHDAQITKGGFYLLSKPQMAGSLLKYTSTNGRVESKLYSNATPFKVNEEDVKDFYDAPVIGIGDALESPKGRRISITGLVTNLTQKLPGPNSTRREFLLKDPELENLYIKVKIWSSELPLIAKLADQDTITLRTVKVDTWKIPESNKLIRSLNSTPETKITMKRKQRTPEETTITVLAVNGLEIFTEELGDLNLALTTPLDGDNALKIGTVAKVEVDMDSKEIIKIVKIEKKTPET